MLLLLNSNIMLFFQLKHIWPLTEHKVGSIEIPLCAIETLPCLISAASSHDLFIFSKGFIPVGVMVNSEKKLGRELGNTLDLIPRVTIWMLKRKLLHLFGNFMLKRLKSSWKCLIKFGSNVSAETYYCTFKARKHIFTYIILQNDLS